MFSVDAVGGNDMFSRDTDCTLGTSNDVKMTSMTEIFIMILRDFNPPTESYIETSFLLLFIAGSEL